MFRNHTPKWIQYVFLWKWFIKIGTSTDLIIAPNFETEPRPKAAIKTVLSLYQAAQGEQFKGWPKEPPGLSWHPGKPETPNDWTESGVFPSGWIIYLQHIGLDVRMTTLHNFKHHSSMYLGEIFHNFTTLKCQIMFRGFTLIQPNCILLVGKWGPPFQSKHLSYVPKYIYSTSIHWTCPKPRLLTHLNCVSSRSNSAGSMEKRWYHKWRFRVATIIVSKWIYKSQHIHQLPWLRAIGYCRIPIPTMAPFKFHSRKGPARAIPLGCSLTFRMHLQVCFELLSLGCSMLKMFGSSLLLEMFINSWHHRRVFCAVLRSEFEKKKVSFFKGKLVIGLGYQKECRKQAARIKGLGPLRGDNKNIPLHQQNSTSEEQAASVGRSRMPPQQAMQRKETSPG